MNWMPSRVEKRGHGDREWSYGDSMKIFTRIQNRIGYFFPTFKKGV